MINRTNRRQDRDSPWREQIMGKDHDCPLVLRSGGRGSVMKVEERKERKALGCSKGL